MAFSSCVQVYVGHGNIVEVVPYADIAAGELLDMTGATKVSVCVGSVETDSDALPSAIWWDSDVNGDWTIYLKLGLVPAIMEGQQNLRVVVYDADYVNGLVLTHDTSLEVIGAC